ncbi:MAG: aldose 1-epimerase family protein [Anaerolineae bacterium]|nr:aldose 1-epimerase family protein [Anaerolineae bacterium]
MFTRSALEAHSTDLRQFIGFRESTLANGQRVIDATNSSGLDFTLLPDRGMDIHTAHFNGLPLTWISQGSPFASDFAGSWLRLFNGGLLTTCGLLHAGAADVDPATGEKRDLHGRYTRLSAYEIAACTFWDGDSLVSELTCAVSENALFGEQLRLERTYRLVVGEPSVTILDRVENRGDQPTPFMILYHFNVGYPLVRAGARLISPAEKIEPRDDAARPGFDRWAEYDAPIPRYAEQVFFHTITPKDGMASVALVNADFGLRVDWDPTYSPYFTQWKNVRQGIYVSGLEPANCLPEGQAAAKANNRLVTLQPGEAHSFRNVLTILPDRQAVAAVEAELNAW